MPKIPDTFCPAKWDELNVSFDTHYAYSCCKSTPTVFQDQVLEFVSKERMNLLNGIQDASCNYCWTVENAGGESLRHRHLKKFNPDNFALYQNNPLPRQVQVTVGNECNFQCTYCNPKFSSKWEQDVIKEPYKVFSDQYFWGIDAQQENVMQKNIDFLKSFDYIENLSIIGGEPLLNKRTFELLNAVPADSLQMVTNLSCKQSILDNFFKQCERYKNVVLVVSIDATNDIAEFVRYGLDFDQFDSNLKYLLSHKPSNLKVIATSLMTSITVRDFANFGKYMTQFLDTPNFEWRIEYCQQPLTQSMVSLPDQYRAELQVAINSMMSYNIWGLATLSKVIATTPFNKTIHQQMVYFMNEFAKRKNITIPLCLN